MTCSLPRLPIIENEIQDRQPVGSPVWSSVMFVQCSNELQGPHSCWGFLSPPPWIFPSWPCLSRTGASNSRSCDVPFCVTCAVTYAKFYCFPYYIVRPSFMCICPLSTCMKRFCRYWTTAVYKMIVRFNYSHSSFPAAADTVLLAPIYIVSGHADLRSRDIRPEL